MFILVLICVSCCFYYTKHRSKQKHLVPFHDTNNKLKGIDINNKFKDTDIKNRLYYFSDAMINIKNLDPNKIKIDKKS